MRYRAFATYYDAEYESHPQLVDDVPMFLRQLPRARQRILELAVGTARAAIPLAQAGHRVVGVDYAADMLDIARRKRDSVGLSDRDLRLVRQDILRLNLVDRKGASREAPFDWACIFFNTFLNFTTRADQDQVLRRARHHLRPGGKLWIDIFLPSLEILAAAPCKGIDGSDFYVHELDRHVHRDTDLKVDSARQLQEVTFNYRWRDAAKRDRHEQLKFDLTYIFPRELELLLERNGFRLIKTIGDYEGGPVTSDSPRLIAVARRVEKR